MEGGMEKLGTIWLEEGKEWTQIREKNELSDAEQWAESAQVMCKGTGGRMVRKATEGERGRDVKKITLWRQESGHLAKGGEAREGYVTNVSVSGTVWQ